MALFKAYSDDKTEKEGSVDQQNIELITESEFPQKVDTHGNKHGSDASDNDLFFIDSMGNQNNLLDNSNARKIERKEDYVQIRKTKKKTKRYLKRKTLDSKPNIFNLNDELKSLQSLLSHDENNIGLWKEFINAQAKNISVGNVKAITERQISIIEEALKKNPRNAELYDLWFQCNRKIYSHNDFTKIIMEQTEKDSGNFQLWLALIDCTQQSISECNVTVVLELYQKAMTCFKKFRHQHTCNKGVLFKLFQRVTVFLRQTGSWKELLYFLEYTMWLNCSDCELSQIFKFPEISNSILIELEEAVLQSGLPLSEIWYRIESLRETFNWSTVKTDFSNLACNLTIEEMDDLTTVFSEDTTKFHLFLHILSVLRIPILPKNYSFYGVIGLTEITWHIDSCEHILYSFYETNEKHSDIMQILYDMLSTIIDGPQYWGPRPFTSDYYDFATTLIKNLMHYSKDEYDKLAFGLLYIRFIMMHINLMKYSKKTINAKSIKKKVKTLLSENNNLKSSIILYVEYAKLEACISDVSSGLNTMMALMNSGNYEVAELSYLIRTCIDYNLISDSKNLDKQLYLKMLAKLVHKEPFNNFDIPIIVAKFYEAPCCTELKNVTSHTILPIAQEHFICCGAYFVYFTLGFQKAIEYINKMSENIHFLIKESLFEWVAGISYLHSEEKIIHNCLEVAISEYPNNSKLLLAYVALPLHWTKIKGVLSHSILGVTLLMCFAKLKESIAFDDTERIAYKNRQSSIINEVMKDEYLTQCPFIWKIYLQFLYENGSEKIMDTMTQAIEKYPWLKAFYVSGVRYVPQEHSAFQDIIAEKELTLLALTEELEILRQDNPDK